MENLKLSIEERKKYDSYYNTFKKSNSKFNQTNMVSFMINRCNIE